MSYPLLLHFARYRDLARSIAERLVAGRGTTALAPWPEEVIVASASVGRAITTELLVLQQSGAAGLRLEPLEALARQILNDAGEYPRLATDGERRLAMRVASRAVDDPLMESRGIGSMLERSYRDVRDSAVSLDRFPARRERTRLIIRAWREYERLVTQLGAIDPAALFTRAANLVSAGAPLRPQLLAGFYDMTGAQLRFVEALRDAGKLAGIWIPSSHPFTRELVTRLAGPAGVDSSATLTAGSPHITIAELDTKQNELRAACQEVRSLLDEGVAPDAIGIVARSLDGHDVQLLNRHAAHFRFGTSRQNEIPLVAHRIGRSVVLLLRLRERGFLRAEVMELVRDGMRTNVRIDADAVDVQTRRARISGGPAEALRAIHVRSRHVDDYVTLVAELEALTRVEGRPWAEVVSGFTSLFALESADDARAVAALDGVADLFRRAARLKTRFDVGSVVDAIEQCSLHPSAPPATPEIWLGDVMQLRGRTFEHLFAVRMQDDLFPQRRVEDALIPDADRRIAGVREIGNGREEEQLLFTLLLDSATDTIHFSFAGTDGFGKVLRPSQLLKNFAIEQAPESRRNILHDFREYIASSYPRTGAQPLLRRRLPARRRSLQLLARAGRNGIFDGYIGPRERFMTALQSISPTQLEDFGECPQKFLFKHLLDVRDFEAPEREVQINHRDKGSLDHRILERFYRCLRAEELEEARHTLPMLPKVLATRLEDGIDEELDAIEIVTPPFNRAVRAIERRATKRNLREFVALDLTSLIEEGLMPRHFEYRFGSKYENADHPASFIVEGQGAPIRVDGSIDRIDSDGDRFRIVDYKSGKALRHQDLGRKIDRGVRLQLALYAMAVSEFFGVDPAKVSGAIKPLAAGRPSRVFEFNLGEKQASLTETLNVFVAAITGGLFPAFPNEGEKADDFNSCKYCPVNHSCRTRHDNDEKAVLREANDPRSLLLQIVPHSAAEDLSGTTSADRTDVLPFSGGGNRS